MTTVFDPSTREELIRRIRTVDESSTARWGRMNVYQMVRHCTLWEAWIQGKPPRRYKQEFLGRVFGRMALRRETRDDRPIARNVPTSKAF
jgi:hypothetical protein